MAVNQQPALRQLTGRSKPAQRTGNEQEKKVKKGRFEKGRRDREWYNLERISRLFKAPRQLWSKKEVLSLGEILFLIDRPDRCLPNSFQPSFSYCTDPGPSPMILLRSATSHQDCKYTVG